MGLEQGLEAKVCVALSHPKGWPTSGTIRVLTRPKKGHIFCPKSHFEGMAENNRKMSHLTLRVTELRLHFEWTKVR